MINFFKYYNSAGLDNEHMRDVIRDALSLIYYEDQGELLSPILHIIKKDCFLAYKYARDVVDGRWPECEPFIITSPVVARAYAQYIIKGRWPEAEPCIRTDESAWRPYLHFCSMIGQTSELLRFVNRI